MKFAIGFSFIKHKTEMTFKVEINKGTMFRKIRKDLKGFIVCV